MKTDFLRITSLFAVGAIILFTSCTKDDDSELANEFKVEPYTNFSLAGNIKVKFTNVNQTDLKSGSDLLVKIKATKEQRKGINVENSNGTLRITADDNITLSDSVEIELTTNDLVEIRLKKDEIAIFEGIEQEGLTVVTEANSQLSLLGSMIQNLTSKQEGESILYLTSFEGFVISYCDFKTEGNTTIYAVDAPISVINIQLQGTSVAEVWAIDSIIGKGEGSSSLYYRGDPDTSEFIIEGDAQIIPLP